MQQLRSFLTIFCCTVIGYAASFAPFTPIQYRNQNILYQQGMGLVPFSTTPLAAGRSRTWLTNDYSSLFEYFQTATEEVRLDLELWRAGIGWARGMGHGFTLEAEWPIWRSDGGFLDGFINWYHGLLRAPTAGRELFPDDQFAVAIQDRTTGSNVYDVAPAPGPVPGDLSLRLIKQLLPESVRRPAIAWFFGIELPTGRKHAGVSNGDLDIGMGIALEKQWKRLRFFLNAAYFHAPPAPGLEPFMLADSFESAAGIGWAVARPLTIVAQINGGTPRLRGIDHALWTSYPFDLMIGITGHHEKAIGGQETVTWQLGFSEDINASGPSIDFTAHAQVGLEF